MQDRGGDAGGEGRRWDKKITGPKACHFYIILF